jgi:hypothetical protein
MNAPKLAVLSEKKAEIGRAMELHYTQSDGDMFSEVRTESSG